MRWFSETPDQHERRVGQWRRWFAWHPVTIGGRQRRYIAGYLWCWLEVVERRKLYDCDRSGGYWFWEYRNA